MLNYIKVMATVTKFKLQNAKPTIHRPIGEQGERGYFIRIGTGGKSGEPLMRVNMGDKVSYFPMYSRNGKTRVNEYVPFKDGLIQRKA